MARNMTTVKNSSKIRFGSAKFEVGETLEDLVDLGAMNGIEFEESWDEVQVTSDNAGVIMAGINNHEATISGDLIEINLENLYLLRGGIDKLETIPAKEGIKEAKRLLSGGITTFQPRVVKITNYNQKNERFSITIFKATSASGIQITFPAGDSEDTAVVPLEMKGVIDNERNLGEQLFEIYDEQNE